MWDAIKICPTKIQSHQKWPNIFQAQSKTHLPPTVSIFALGSKLVIAISALSTSSSPFHFHSLTNSMFSLKIHQLPLSFFYSQVTPPRPFISYPLLPAPLLSPLSLVTRIFLKPNHFLRSNIPRCKPTFRSSSVSGFDATVGSNGGKNFDFSPQLDDLSQDGVVYQKTLALVECSMFAALSGLVYFLSNSLAIEVSYR